MSVPSKEEIDQFINALQLSISSKITNYFLKEPYLQILFEFSKNDEALEIFNRLIGYINGSSPTGGKGGINFPLEKITSELTQFLMLTRLKKQNMFKLAQQDTHYRVFTDQLFQPDDSLNLAIKNSADVAQIIFNKLKKENKTLRSLSEKTGLTPMTLHKLKKGGDIRLSSLIKLCEAVGLRVKIGN